MIVDSSQSPCWCEVRSTKTFGFGNDPVTKSIRPRLKPIAVELCSLLTAYQWWSAVRVRATQQLFAFMRKVNQRSRRLPSDDHSLKVEPKRLLWISAHDFTLDKLFTKFVPEDQRLHTICPITALDVSQQYINAHYFTWLYVATFTCTLINDAQKFRRT